jgi:hypothetical protein
MKPTTMVRLWSLQNVILLWLIRPKIHVLNANQCIVRVPLNWITRRKDIRAMYLGTLCMGADVAAGLIAFQTVAEKRQRINFIFKDMKAEFLKRAEGEVWFTNDDGPVIQDLIQRALTSGEREEATVHVTATVPEKLGNEAVAKFELTLSIRKKS